MKQHIVNKYITPLKRPRTHLVGIELELPIVNRKQEPVDFTFVHRITEDFVQEYQPKIVRRDDNGFVYNLQLENEDDISFDCSYNTLEFSFAPDTSLYAIQDRFYVYYKWFQKHLGKEDHMLTGMGINPNRSINTNEPVANERYRMLYSYLCENDFPYPNYGFFACAAQIQMDADIDTLIPSMKVFNRIEPYLSVLFANSPLDSYVLARDWFWEKSMHGINPKNVGAFDPVPNSIDEMVDYIADQSMYCVMRDGKYLHFDPIPYKEYIQMESVEALDSSENKQTLIPSLDDIEYLRAFKLEDLTYRGTIEHRSLCMQPVHEVFSVLAFMAGIEANKEALLNWKPSLDIHREIVNKKGQVRLLDQEKLIRDCLHLYDVAYDGLKKRNLGEEKLLEIIYPRFQTATSPALEMLESDQSLDSYIDSFSQF